MAKSTVIAIKAEISEFKKDLDALRSHAKETYSALNNETKKASQQWDKYNSVLKENSKNLKKLERDIQKLNAVKLKNGSLTKDETAQLKKLKAQLSAQKAINRDLASAELAKYNATKRNINAYKASLNAIRAQENYLKSEIATTQKSIASKNKSTAASKSHTASLKKEDAIRRSAATTIVRHIRMMESMAVAYYSVKNAWQNTFGAGVALNRQYESMSLGLSALLAAKTADITTTGKQISSYEKLQIAQSMTASTMDDIKKASFDTVATFDQMVGFYQQAIGHALAAGDAFGGSIEEISKNTIDLTKRMSNLGGSVGMSMDLINEEVRSLMSGDVSRDSKLALILFGSPTEANKAIKEAKKSTDGLTKLFDEVLEPFAQLESIMTFDKQIANLKGEFQSLQKEFSKPIFNDLKEQAAELTAYLKENSDEISKNVVAFYNGAKNIAKYANEVVELYAAYKTASIVMSAYTKASAIVSASNIAMSGTYGALNRSIIAATVSTKAFSLATKAIPYIALTAGIYALYKAVEAEQDTMSIAARNMEDYAKSIKHATTATVDFELAKLTKKQAELNIESGKEWEVSRSVTNPHYEKISRELTIVAEQIELLTKRKNELIEKTEEEKELTEKLGKLKQKLQQSESSDKANKATQKQIDLNNKLYNQYLNIIGTPYDRWALSVSDIIAELGKSTELTAEDFVNLGEALEQTNPLLAQQEQAAEKARELYSSIMATDYDKWLESTSDKMRVLAEGGIYTNEQLTAVWNTMQSDYEINLTINGIDDMQSKFDDMIDSQISLATGVNDWGNNLTGVSKNFANVAKSMNAFKVNDLKFDKTAHKLKTKYAKDSLKIEKSKIPAEQKVLKQKELAANFDKDYSQAKNQQFSNELNAYSNLAGAIGSFYEAGSTAAKAAQAVQATLGIVNGYGAITQAWASAPFPANLPGVAAATAAVLPMIAQLTSLGGSGGGGSSGGGAGKVAGTESRINTITNESTVIIDELKRQTALLEAINLHGSSESLKVKSSQVTFESEYKLWIEKTLQNVAQGGWTQLDDNAVQAKVDTLESNLGFDVYSRRGDNLYINGGSMRQGDNLLQAITESLKENFTGILGIGSDYKNLKFAAQEAKTAALMQDVNSLQNTISDWALSVIDSMNSLSDASDDFKDSFDKVTGSMYYENKKLADAYRDVNIATNGGNLDDYLQATITNIDGLNTFFTDDNLSLLLSSNIDDIPSQIEKVKELSAITGKSFENGAKDALDYLDSIKLVSEAMAQSKQNQKDFIDSFKTDEQLTADKARKLGVSVATSTNELVSLFSTLSGGIGGLTDKELDFLTANKDLIGSFDDIIAKYDESIDTLASVIDSVQSTLDKLYGSILGSSYTMQQYYDAMSRAMRADLTDAKAYQDLVNDAISKSSVLFDANNYQTSKDQQFAQLLAAKQFESIQDVSVTQIDYLKYIEANTRESNAHLIAMLQALSDDINTQYASSNTTVVDNAYNEVLGRDAEVAGSNYWSNQLSSGAISVDNLNSTIAQSAIAYSGNGSSAGVTQDVVNKSKSNAIDYLANTATPQATSSTNALVHGIYQKYDLDQYQTDDSGYNYWSTQIKTGALSVSDLEATIKKAAEENLHHNVVAKFAEGGIVTKPTLGLIGEAGYNEAVIPLKDSNDPLQTKELVSAIKDLTAIVLQQAEDGRESRKLSEDQLLTLLDIEEKIT